MRRKGLGIFACALAAAVLAVNLWLPVSVNAENDKKAGGNTATGTTTEERNLTIETALAAPGNVEGSGITMAGGWAGMRITVGDKDIAVTALGRWYTSESARTHNFLIVNLDGSIVLDYGKAVATAPEGTAEGFVYGELNEKITLTKNTSYYIVSDYQGDRDKFYAGAASVTTADASIDGIVILNGAQYDFSPAAGIGWGPLDVKYEVEVSAQDVGNELTLTQSVAIAEPGNVPGSAVTMPGGWAGMRVTVGDKDISVTALGRWSTGESAKTHNFLITNTDGSIVLDYGKAVATASEGASEGFVYGKLSDQVTLKKNTSYYIVSDYQGSTDKFYAGAVSTTRTEASIDGIVILDGATNQYNFIAAANVGWGPLDMKYEVKETGESPDPSQGGENNNSSGNTGTGGNQTNAPEQGSEADIKEVNFTRKVKIAGPGNVSGSNVSMPAGWAGMRITVGGKDIKLTALGRWYTKGSALTHNFLIANVDGSLVLDYGKAVAVAKEGAKDGFVYGEIKGGVVLKANTTYYIISDYMGADDKFFAASESTHSSVATIDGIVILNGETYEFHEAPNTGWGPLDFKYMSDGSENPKTGDGSNRMTGIWMLALAVSGCGIAFLYQKKRTNRI